MRLDPLTWIWSRPFNVQLIFFRKEIVQSWLS
jgi:hypothetical protein